MFDKDGKLKEQLIRQAAGASQKTSRDILLDNPLLIQTPAPEGSLCPKCKAENLTISRMPLTGPYSGTIYCGSCDFRNSVIGYLGKQMFRVEPMPLGAELIYTKEPEEK